MPRKLLTDCYEFTFSIYGESRFWQVDDMSFLLIKEMFRDKWMRPAGNLDMVIWLFRKRWSENHLSED